MANVTISQITAATGAAPGALELVAYNPADASVRTRKWTLSTLLAALTAPDFTTLRVATGATVSRLLAFNGSIAVTSLAAGAEVDVTFAATGVLVNDHVVMSPRGTPPAGLIYQPWVSDADEISVRVTNTGSGSATASLATSFAVVRTS